MLKNGSISGDLGFQMGLHHECSVDIRFSDIIDYIKASSATRKILFIDPLVLANNNSFLELELNCSDITLIPTNINEGSKELQTIEELLRLLENKGIGRRNELVCAIGGGALMDAVAFAASIFRRGIKVIKIPTTLLGVVDAAIGIKTGVNFEAQRNRIGSYHFAFDVVIDTKLLHGLSKGMLRQGLGEIFKIAVIKGPNLFSMLELHKLELECNEFYIQDPGIKVMAEAIRLMLEELHENPTESNLMRCVDFGHSFCPLVEMESLRRNDVQNIPHGFAVAYDCLLTTTISLKRNLISQDHYDKILNLYENFDFGFDNKLYENHNLLWASFVELIKHRGDAQNLPVPSEIGKYEFLQDVDFEEMVRANQHLKKVLNA